MERDFVIESAPKVKNVLIIGGGPAGMEAARVAALRGHRVTLWEKGNALGGSLVPASGPDFKKDFGDLIQYQGGQLKKLGVTVEFSKQATQAQILQMKPDVLFLAMGSIPMIPEIPGVEKEKVATAVDILLGKKRAGESAVIIGGGLVGCETALFLVQEVKSVVVVEILSDIAGDIFISTQQHMKKLLADAGAKVLTQTQVLEIREEGALILDQHGQKSLLAADSIILAIGMKAGEMGFDEIKSQIPEVYAIGDCVAPRRVINAIWEGFRLARLV
jgi:2-enoate reductase